MEYGYKPTTNGRKVLIACMDSGGSLQLTRVAVGKGLVSEDAELADQHTLVDYVADGAIGDRRHENERLYLTVQYSNKDHRDIPTFYLSEFIIYAINPDTGEETDLLYATLGDYAQPVPAFRQDYPASVFNFPLVLILSDEINVSISAPAGLVTYDELIELQNWQDITIPAAGWTADEDTGGVYPYHRDIAVEYATDRSMPYLTVYPASMPVAEACRMAPYARAQRGKVRVYALRQPGEDIKAGLMLLSNPPYVRSGDSGGGSGYQAQAGLGLSMTPDGRLNVNAGKGMSIDANNNLTVDTQTVMTDADLLDENATEQDLRDILLG